MDVGVDEDSNNVERKSAKPALLILAIFLAGYTLVQYFAFSWNFTNLFVGILAMILCIVIANCTPRTFLQPVVRVVVNISAVYCAVVAGLLFFFRIQI